MGLVQVFLHEQGGFRSILGFTSSSDGFCMSWKRVQLGAGFASLSPLVLLLRKLQKQWPTLQSNILSVEIKPQREVGIGGQHADQVLDEGLHLVRIILMKLGARG